MRALWIILPFLLLSCKTQEVVTEPVDVPPEWVRQKPLDFDYYSGIGMAYKSTPDFQSIAKNNALNDLSSEISVQINSSSVLYQVEQNENFREEFKANTRLKSIENLEGFELAGTYENGREYWVFYRLSKSEFNAIKAARKQTALDRSTDLFKKAQWFRENLQYDDALIFGIKAMESIREYLGEGLLVEMEGESIYYGNELYSFITDLVNDIQILPAYEHLEIIRGNSLKMEQLSFLVSNREGTPLDGIPIYFYYSGDRIKNNEVLSNSNGIVSFALKKIISKHNREYFQANLNMVHLVKEATDDPIISQLVSKLSGPESRIEIDIKSPSVYITSEESRFGEPLNVHLLQSAFKKEFLESGFMISAPA